MSPQFLAFMPFIFEWEGDAYENDSDDPGGETKFGIDKRSHPHINIRDLTKDQALEIYWQEWVADGCEPMPSPYAEVFFNCAVNMGLSRARQFDKAIPGANINSFLDQQEAYYIHLANNGTKFRKYLKGWLNRTRALRKRFS